MAERKKKDNPHRFGAHLHKDKKSDANDRNRTTTVAKTAKVSRPIAIITSMCHLYYMQKSETKNKTFAFLSEKLFLRNGMLLYLMNE